MGRCERRTELGEGVASPRGGRSVRERCVWAPHERCGLTQGRTRIRARPSINDAATLRAEGIHAAIDAGKSEPTVPRQQRQMRWTVHDGCDASKPTCSAEPGEGECASWRGASARTESPDARTPAANTQVASPQVARTQVLRTSAARNKPPLRRINPQARLRSRFRFRAIERLDAETTTQPRAVNQEDS